MLIARAFLALFAGFVAMAILIAAATALLSKLAPSWVGATGSPRPAYVCFNLVYSCAAAMAGGAVTTWVARDNALVHALALALIVLLLAALSALQLRGQQPIWYQLLLVGITPIGVVAGAWLRLRLIGVL